MIRLPAIAMAPAARDWLAQTVSARVLNVFDRAVNLVNLQVEVLSIVSSERALTPFALVVATGERAPFRALTEASELRVQPDRLALGSFVIAVEAARLWEPSPDWPAVRQLFAGAGWLERLNALAVGRGPTGSLLELLD